MGIGLLAGRAHSHNKISGLRKFSNFDLVYKMLFSPLVLLVKPHFSSYISIIPKIYLFALLHHLKKKKLLSMLPLLSPPHFNPFQFLLDVALLKSSRGNTKYFFNQVLWVLLNMNLLCSINFQKKKMN